MSCMLRPPCGIEAQTTPETQKSPAILDFLLYQRLSFFNGGGGAYHIVSKHGIKSAKDLLANSNPVFFHNP